MKKVELEGVERFEEDEFYEYLNLRPTGPFAWRNKHYYVPGLEAVDEGRIESLYEAHGYYDAEVEAIDVKVLRPDEPLRKQRAHVRIEVDEGAPTRVRHVQYEWPEKTDSRIDRDEIEAEAVLRVGEDFDLPGLQKSRDAMRDALLDRGFPQAKVVDEAWVDPERHVADVRYRIEPGPWASIGQVHVEGLERVPEYLVLREAKPFRGKPFSPKRLRQIESAVYGLGVFSSVSVEAPTVKPDGTVDVRVRVTESKLQRFKAGVGLGIDPVRWEQHAVVAYTHESVFGHLTRLDARAKVGYAELPALYRPDEHGPLVDLTLEMRKKGLLEDQLVWTASPGFELGIWQGYQFYTVTHRIGVSRFITRFVELGTSYNNRFTDFFNVSPVLDRNRTILGLDFRDPYVLAFWQATATLHLTDKLIAPDNGVKLLLTYDLASTYLGGQFDFHKFEPDLRAYWRPHDRIKLAGRFRVGLISPYGRNPGVPIDLQWYLGGSNDVRGWPLRRLSPRVVSCDDDGDCDDIPVGGKTMVHGSAEFRVRLVAELWAASFFDLGDVRSETFSFDVDGWMYSTGGGLRYDSPIGLFRLDAGVRLNDDPRFPEPRIWAIHFGLGEAF